MQRMFIFSVFLIVGCVDSNNVGRQDPLQTCTPPQPALACTVTQDCGNYPTTVCDQTGFCVCPPSDAGAQTPDASGTSCTLPQTPLACTVTQDCANYPTTVCGQTGFCACPSTNADAATCTPPQTPLACTATQGCSNYPNTVCGQTGFCVCP